MNSTLIVYGQFVAFWVFSGKFIYWGNYKASKADVLKKILKKTTQEANSNAIDNVKMLHIKEITTLKSLDADGKEAKPHAFIHTSKHFVLNLISHMICSTL